MLVHGIRATWGIRLQNTLGVFKLFILSGISLLGVFCLAGFPGIRVLPGYDIPENFKWHNMWEGSGRGANAFVTGLYSVIWSDPV